MLGLRLDAARSRLALARTLESESPEIAIDTARQARNELDVLGDSREADIAAALMRSLGEGLTNAEIAARLFISPKPWASPLGVVFGQRLKARGGIGCDGSVADVTGTAQGVQIVL